MIVKVFTWEFSMEGGLLSNFENINLNRLNMASCQNSTSFK